MVGGSAPGPRPPRPSTATRPGHSQTPGWSPLTIGVFGQQVLGTHDGDFQGVCGGLWTEGAEGPLGGGSEWPCPGPAVSSPPGWPAPACTGWQPHLGLLHTLNGLSVLLGAGTKHLRTAGQCEGPGAPRAGLANVRGASQSTGDTWGGRGKKYSPVGQFVLCTLPCVSMCLSLALSFWAHLSAYVCACLCTPVCGHGCAHGGADLCYLGDGDVTRQRGKGWDDSGLCSPEQGGARPAGRVEQWGSPAAGSPVGSPGHPPGRGPWSPRGKALCTRLPRTASPPVRGGGGSTLWVPATPPLCPSALGPEGLSEGSRLSCIPAPTGRVQSQHRPLHLPGPPWVRPLTSAPYSLLGPLALSPLPPLLCTCPQNPGLAHSRRSQTLCGARPRAPLPPPGLGLSGHGWGPQARQGLVPRCATGPARGTRVRASCREDSREGGNLV